LKSSNPADRKLRQDLVHGLHWFEDRRAVPLAIEILRNRRESKVVRECAAYLFHRLTDSRATPVLIEILMNSKEPSNLRTICAEALGACRRGELSAVKALITCLGDADPYVRTFSALALAFCGNKSALEPLKKLSADKTPVPPYGKVADDAKYALNSIR
jgi:HEAT repeat protein